MAFCTQCGRQITEGQTCVCGHYDPVDSNRNNGVFSAQTVLKALKQRVDNGASAAQSALKARKQQANNGISTAQSALQARKQQVDNGNSPAKPALQARKQQVNTGNSPVQSTLKARKPQADTGISPAQSALPARKQQVDTGISPAQAALQARKQQVDNGNSATQSASKELKQQVDMGTANRNITSNRGEIVMSEGEQKVKTYHCSRLSFPSCNGYLTVTNKRVIFHGYSGGYSVETLPSDSNWVADEVLLDSVSGISSLYGRTVKVSQIILGIFIFFIGIVVFGLGTEINNALIVLALMIIFTGILLIFLSIKRIFSLRIFSSKANGSPIAIGEGVGNIPAIGSSSVYSIIGEPTNETNKMMLELGALIIDLQTMGDLALDKWSAHK